MKAQDSDEPPNFVEYNDENLEHVMAGPDYGQPWSSSCWREVDSKEYPDFVEEICDRILRRHIKLVSD